jgi:hypothetical protein
MKTMPAPINLTQSTVLACPAATKERLRLPRRHRSAVLYDGTVMVPQLSRTICRLVEVRANDVGHDHSLAS